MIDLLSKLLLSYCISCWGAIPNSKSQNVFAIQVLASQKYGCFLFFDKLVNIVIHVKIWH